VEALKIRLENYHQQTVPILDHYAAKVVKMDCNDNNGQEESERQVIQLLIEQNLIPQPPMPSKLSNS
jgi:adenylate kinase family enzyme